MALANPDEDPDTITRRIEKLVDAIERVPVPEAIRERIRKRSESLGSRLSRVAARLDSVLTPKTFFDPGNPQTAGHMVALATIAQPRHRLSTLPKFYGAGVYALYYNGPFDAYRELSQSEQPIYIGKADPKKPDAKNAKAQGDRLYKRLLDHRKSIQSAAGTLNVDDFDCRFLVVQSGYQNAAERYLINFFKPIWNAEIKICYGIGKHGDSAETRANKRSPWDTLHPGRGWALRSIEDQKSEQQIRQEINAHLTKHKPYRSVEDVLATFFGDLRQMASSDFTTAFGEEVSVDA
jgi:Eco29kI restriction endonuclease.